METFKKYLPFIVIAIVGFILLRMFKGSGAPKILPQSQFSEVPNPDPYAQFRLPAFQALAELGVAQTQAEAQSKSEQTGLQSLLATLQNALSIETLKQTTAQQANTFARDLQAQGQLIGQNLGLAGIESRRGEVELQTELQKYLQSTQLDFNKFLQNSYLRELELNFQQRENDRQAQQMAIDRYYANQRSGQIIGSIGQALGSIFDNQGGGNVFGTPPIFGGFF